MAFPVQWHAPGLQVKPEAFAGSSGGSSLRAPQPLIYTYAMPPSRSRINCSQTFESRSP